MQMYGADIVVVREPEQELESVFYKLVPPEKLNPHPLNASIYGDDENISELVDLISRTRWIKPLVVTPSNTIISGHRCWKAVLALGWESVFVEVREFQDELSQLEALLLENASRAKTTEQKVREGLAWSDVENKKARIRQISLAGTRPNSKPNLVENFPQGHTGKTRDHIAARVGLGSGRTYSKAAKVIYQIDEAVSQGHLEIAQALRKVLNEQSIEAAHTLLKKSPQERHTIANLIVSGQAKSTFQARQMIRQNDYVEFNNSFITTLAGFSVGDWVTVNEHAQGKAYIGLKGQVELLLAVEEQISVKLSDAPDKVKFYPYELTLISKATPSYPFCIGDLVFVDIDRHEAASAQEKKWNGCWGKVTQIGERGSVTVDVGKESLRLFPRDLKPIDAPSVDLRHVVERVLRLRSLDLDEIEEKMLDVIQRLEWCTPKQLIHLENIEKLYPPASYYHPDTYDDHNANLFETQKRHIASV